VNDPARRPWFEDSVGAGIRIAVLTHLVGLPLCYALAVQYEARHPPPEARGLVPYLLIWFVGWVQLAYMPAPALILLFTRRFQALKGLGVAVGVLFLATGACAACFLLANA